MADGRGVNRSRRMDLNLYLGLPRSPVRRRGSDLGSDLALGSYLLTRQDIQIPAEMGSLLGESEYHDPYSPTHASLSPNERSEERDEDESRQQFECPRCSSRPPTPPSDDGLADSSRGVFEYSAFLPSEAPNVVLQETQTVVETLVGNTSNGAHHVPYSLPYHPTVASDGLENSETVVAQENSVIDLVHYVPYSPGYVSPTAPVDPAEPEEPLNGVNGDSHASYSPSYTEMDPSTQVGGDVSHNGRSSESMATFTAPFTANGEMTNLLTQNDSSRRDLLQNPEFRLQRLIEANRHRPSRRFRSTVPYVVDPITASSLSPTQILEELMESERSAGTSMAHKVNAVDPGKRGVEDEKKENENMAANFDCNVCLEMAKDPVVTSCGHLFCWPCLYQWLHLYCDYRECPVCKGQVQESDITPIYGRGSVTSRIDNNDEEERDSGLKIPPRPHGHRLESTRQLSRQLSLHRWLGDIRSIFGEDMQQRGRLEGFERRNLQDIIDDGSRRFFSRFRAIQRLRRERMLEHQTGVAAGAVPMSPADNGFNANGGFNSNGSNNHTDAFHGTPSSSSHMQDIGDFYPFTTPYNSSVRFNPLSAGLPGASVRATNSGSHSGLPPYSGTLGGGDVRGQAMTAEASASSTMAVIQGDVGAVDAYAEPEASGAGTSRSMRRRRNGSSGSLDIDDAHPARKRRRLN